MAHFESKIYSTQMLLLQKAARHSNIVYYREIDKTIYEWVKTELPRELHSSFEKNVPFDDFHRKESRIIRHNGRRIYASQTLETERLICHGLTVRRYVPSCFKRDVEDAYFETSLCIEADKKAKDGCVHFSISVSFFHEPIRGFYPSKSYEPVMPELVNMLLAGPNNRAEFVQTVFKSDGKESSIPRPPIVKYIVDDSRTMRDEDVRRDFIAQLSDPLRPVCLVVVFGAGCLARYMMNRLALKLFSKACVYHIETLTPNIKEALEREVLGIDVDRDMKEGVCRVFFPLGPYMREDWANPRYPIRLFRINDIVQLIKKGCFASFAIGDLMWRKDDYDVYKTRKRLHESRKEESSIEAAFAVAEHQDTCEKIIAVRDKKITHLEREKMNLEAERQQLIEENAKCKADLSRANARVAALEAVSVRLNSKTRVVNVQLELQKGEIYYPDELRDAILHTLQRGVSSLNSDGRYVVLIRDVLRNNSKSDFETRIESRLKTVLLGNKNVQRGDLAALEELGFQYVSGNKHHQIAFMGDERLMYTIGKTPSDRCSARNCISDILKRLFQ